VCAVLFLCGCDSPKKGFNEWRDALLNGKIDKANARTIKKSQAMNGLLAAGLQDDKKAQEQFRKTEVVSVTENGDKATLKLKDASGETSEFKMVKEDGKWKVAPEK